MSSKISEKKKKETKTKNRKYIVGKYQTHFFFVLKKINKEKEIESEEQHYQIGTELSTITR